MERGCRPVADAPDRVAGGRARGVPAGAGFRDPGTRDLPRCGRLLPIRSGPGTPDEVTVPGATPDSARCRQAVRDPAASLPSCGEESSPRFRGPGSRDGAASGHVESGAPAMNAGRFARCAYATTLVAALVPHAGCTSWHPVIETAPAAWIARERPREVRLTAGTGTRLRVRSPIVVNDSIVAADTPLEARPFGTVRPGVHVSEIRGLEVSRFDPAKTVLLGAGIVAVSIAWARHASGRRGGRAIPDEPPARLEQEGPAFLWRVFPWRNRAMHRRGDRRMRPAGSRARRDSRVRVRVPTGVSSPKDWRLPADHTRGLRGPSWRPSRAEAPPDPPWTPANVAERTPPPSPPSSIPRWRQRCARHSTSTARNRSPAPQPPL